MSAVEANKVQVGNSPTALNNLVISTDGAGNATIEQGVIGGGSNRVVMTIDSAGKVTPNVALQTPPSLAGSFYEAVSTTVTTTGCLSLSRTITATRIGDVVTVKIPSTLATATAAGVLTFPLCLPAGFIPSALQSFVGVARMKNNNAFLASSLFQLDTSGGITFYVDSGGTAFTNATQVGITDPFCISFKI